MLCWPIEPVTRRETVICHARWQISSATPMLQPQPRAALHKGLAIAPPSPTLWMRMFYAFLGYPRPGCYQTPRCSLYLMFQIPNAHTPKSSTSQAYMLSLQKPMDAQRDNSTVGLSDARRQHSDDSRFVQHLWNNTRCLLVLGCIFQRLPSYYPTPFYFHRPIAGPSPSMSAFEWRLSILEPHVKQKSAASVKSAFCVG